MLSTRLIASTFLALVAVSSLAAQQTAPCDGAPHRQFDFWIGEWDVYLPDGRVAGSNSIQPKLGGCVLHERWTSAGSHAGESFNIRGPDGWHQSWVDNGGLLLLLDGGLVGKAMVMTGTTKDAAGRSVLNRITWTPISADSVRQHWEVSTNAGTDWSTAFDGMYVRKR